MRSFRVFHVSRPALLALLALALLMAPAALARPSRPGAETFPGAVGAIAFASDRGGGPAGNIWRMDVDGHNATNLTSDGTFNQSPAWSASGTQLAFASDRSGSQNIWRMTATGAGLTQLTHINDADVFNRNPAWFPSDRRVVYESNRLGYFALWAQDVDASGAPVGDPVQLTQLTDSSANDTEPSVSPNGKLIAFVSNRRTATNPQGDPEIFVMKANAPEGPNNVPKQLTQNNAADESPDWKPNGKQIAFASVRAGDFQIYTMTQLGRNEQPLTPAGQAATQPTWSANGQQLAYVVASSGGDRSDVYRINADGTQSVNLTEGSAGTFNDQPAWQPR
jgi:Tol biopolymer transport system component